MDFRIFASIVDGTAAYVGLIFDAIIQLYA